jgi:division protein CdvB (Snf7/Vps24/ESCRT-III family)
MKIWNNKSTKEILQSIEPEIAKAQNEIKCAEGDVRKAQSRLAFILSAIHNLKTRDIQE